MIIRTDAMCYVVGDFLIENNTGSAGGENEESDNESAKIK